VSGRDPARAIQDALRDQLVAAARREPDPSRAAHNALRDALTQAARREHERAGAAPVPARPRRRRRRRAAAVTALTLLGAAAAAQATGLISVGDPIPPLSERRASEAPVPPQNLGVDLVATAPDRGGRPAWGVAVYRADDGRECAIAGQLRGRTLGLIENGRFRPYSDLKAGACGDLSRTPILLDRLLVRGNPTRSIVYGRTAASNRPVRVSVSGGQPRSATPGRGGGFLFVFDGVVDPGRLRVLAP
jgi:hypothetical protein